MRFISYFTTLLAAMVLSSCQPADSYVVIGGYAQGGTYAVKLNVAGVNTRQQEIQDTVDTLLRQIDFSLSGYNKSSLLSRLNAGDTIVPDKWLCELYNLSYQYFMESCGALDVSSGPLFDIWGFGFREGQLPSGEQVRVAMSSCGMDRLKPRMEDALRADGTLCASDLLLDPSQSAPVLNFNAIAQGYSCDVIASYLKSLGVHDMLVDIGEIYCEGLNPSGKPWNVGIDSPKDGNFSPGTDIEGIWHSCGNAGQGVVTSGNYRKYYVRDGRKYSHTIDPRTGEPVTHSLLCATVIAPDATTADAVATWCMVVGLEDARIVLERLGLEACLIYDHNGSFEIWKTDGFDFD